VEQVRGRKMRKQRNTAQIKEKGRNSDQINKEEISNLPERRKLHSTANVNVKVEICRGNKQRFIRKKKGLKVILILGCGVCPHAWGWVSVL